MSRNPKQYQREYFDQNGWGFGGLCWKGTTFAQAEQETKNLIQGAPAGRVGGKSKPWGLVTNNYIMLENV